MLSRPFWRHRNDICHSRHNSSSTRYRLRIPLKTIFEFFIMGHPLDKTVENPSDNVLRPMSHLSIADNVWDCRAVWVRLTLMLTPSNGNIFRVIGPLWGESTSHPWIPLTKGCDGKLRYFLWSAPEQTVEQTTEKQVVWDTITLIMTSLQRNVEIQWHFARSWRPYWTASSCH